MASHRQKPTARSNMRKAAETGRQKHTIAHLPKGARTALGKHGAKLRPRKRAHNGT